MRRFRCKMTRRFDGKPYVRRCREAHSFNALASIAEYPLSLITRSKRNVLTPLFCIPGERNMKIYRGYYTVARRYEFYFRVAKQYFTNERTIDKIIEGNDRNYVIDKLKCEIMENKPLGSRM